MIFSLLLLVSMGIVSYKLKIEEVINPYCYLENEQLSIQIYHDNIIGFSYQFDCNTLKMEIEIEKNLTKDEIIAILMDIKNQFENNNLFYKTHVILSSESLTTYIFANLNLGNDGIIFIGN